MERWFETKLRSVPNRSWRQSWTSHRHGNLNSQIIAVWWPAAFLICLHTLRKAQLQTLHKTQLKMMSSCVFDAWGKFWRTFSCLFLLVEVDEEVSRAFGAEGQHDSLQYGWQDGEGEQHGPQIIWTQQRLQAKDLKHKNQGMTSQLKLMLAFFIWTSLIANPTCVPAPPGCQWPHPADVACRRLLGQRWARSHPHTWVSDRCTGHRTDRWSAGRWWPSRMIYPETTVPWDHRPAQPGR